ncbi:MAG: F0F1 ATP synthase subunit B [Oscillospiraceae bacterium]|nr:F0F1 ATP synthase subunit B [Oscillospiraceae bacterium]
MEGFESFVGVNFWTALFTLCNLIITFLLLKKFLFKPVRKMIVDRQNEIDGLFADADSSRQEAERLKERYETDLAGAQAEREEILRDAAEKARRREEEIVSEAKAQAAAILEKAQSDLQREKKKAVNEIKDDISGIAISIAEKVVERQLDAEDQRELIASFIDSLGEAQ